jgi:release factor glutamine methyltransferase
VSAPLPRSWRTVRREVRDQLASAGIEAADAEARWLTECASGYAGAEWHDIERTEPLPRAARHLAAMMERRLAGEPLQYVLGAWSFRGLDLMVDHDVLIPRPETEWVVEIALREAEQLGLRRRRAVRLGEREPSVAVADLGTGSGAIALALEAELPDALVWATDVSERALRVAAANVSGCGATRVRIAHGDWFAALPAELAGTLVLVVANPPYIADHEVAELPNEVIAHEPRGALVSGPTGMEDVEALVAAAPRWLAPGGALVLEIAATRAQESRAAVMHTADYASVDVFDDLTGRPRVLVARVPSR